MSAKNKKDSDLQGITRLATEATLGITEIVEDMHKRVVHPPKLPSTPIQKLVTKIAGFTFKSIKKSTQFVGNNLDIGLGHLAPLLKKMKPSKEKEALRSVLNGVVGNYLEEKNNPLQIRMQFRNQLNVIPLNKQGIQDAYPEVNGKILLMVHGLCMNDLQFTRKEHNHGFVLGKELGKTPIFLHYNTGLHISANGKSFNNLLEALVLNWPVPVEELIIVGHSMGGLVTRSALHYAQAQKIWTKHLKKVVFLGSPHHGAPLERVGNYIDLILESVPYSKPFARLGKIRSSGITDLRHGNIIDEDWQFDDRFEKQKDHRHTVPPLPKDIECYSVAAVMGSSQDFISHKVIGDGLVTVESALGQHEFAEKHLAFKKENTWITYQTSHLDLLNDVGVYQKIKTWLS